MEIKKYYTCDKCQNKDIPEEKIEYFNGLCLCELCAEEEKEFYRNLLFMSYEENYDFR